MSPLSSETPFIGFLFISTSKSDLLPCEKLSFWLCSSIPQSSHCIKVSSIHSRSTLRSSARGHLVVPRSRTSIAQSRSFAIVGPSNWNKLLQSLRDLFPISSYQFRKHLKTSLFVSEDIDLGQERL